MFDFFYVEINVSSYFAFKVYSGFIFLLDLFLFTPYFQRDFGVDYQVNSFVSSKVRAVLFWFVWFICSTSLFLAYVNWLAPLVLAIIFRYFYIYSRGTNLFRGGGAVGMFPAFIATSIFVVEFFLFLGFSWTAVTLFLNFMLFHVGVVTLCAGIYKLTSGYLRGEGLEYALYNHMWSYWGFFFKGRPLPNKLLIRAVDCWIAVQQTGIGILMIATETRAYGTFLLSLGFFALFFILKLGNLCLLVIAYSLLFVDFEYFYFTSFGLNILGGSSAFPVVESSLPLLFTGLAIIYLLIKGLQYGQFYFRLSLPKKLRLAVEKIGFYAPILVWRVFSADIVNFFIKVEEVDEDGKTYRLNPDTFYNKNAKGFFAKVRFFHVAESCVLSSIFLSVRYDPENFPEASEKLKRYSNTLWDQMLCSTNKLEFTYTKLLKTGNHIEYVDVEKWILSNGNIQRELLTTKHTMYENESTFLRPLGKFGSYEK